MRVVAYDPFVGAERYRELGVEKAETLRRASTREADFITLHLPKTPETEGWLDAEAFAKCKDGVRILNVARGPLIVDEDLEAALDSRQGRRRGARRLPLRADHRAPAVRPTRTSSSRRTSAPRPPRRPTAPASRPPSRSSPRSPAAPSRPRSTCPPIARRGPRGARAVRAALPRSSAASRSALAEGSSVDRVEVEYLGRIAERDTRPLGIAVLLGVAAAATPRRRSTRSTRPSIAEERGIEVVETTNARRARLHRPRARDRRLRATAASASSARCSAAATARTCSRPGASASTSSSSDHLAIFRYRDVPGHDRPRRHRVRRARRQHRLGRGRPRAGRRRRRRPRGDGRHDRRAGAARTSSTRSSPADGFVARPRGRARADVGRLPDLPAVVPGLRRRRRRATCAASSRASTTSRRSAPTRSGCRRSTRRRWPTAATTSPTTRDVDPRFGTLADADALIAAAHERGLKVLFDVVPCHTSIEHPWFREHPELLRVVGPRRPAEQLARDVRRPGVVARPGTGRWYLHSFYPEQPDLELAQPRGAPRRSATRCASGWTAASTASASTRWTGILKDPRAARRPAGARAARRCPRPTSTRRSSRATRATRPTSAPALAQLRAAAGDALLVGEVYLPSDRLGALPRAPRRVLQLRAAPRAVGGRHGARRASRAASATGQAAWVLSNHDFPRLPDRVGPAQRPRRGAAAAHAARDRRSSTRATSSGWPTARDGAADDRAGRDRAPPRRCSGTARRTAASRTGDAVAAVDRRSRPTGTSAAQRTTRARCSPVPRR